MESPTSKTINISPREYQKRIFETAKDHNTLVVLPTGLGKTLVSLMLAVERKFLFPDSKILLLAPTRPLIEQHFHYFKAHLPELFADMQLFTGSVPAKKRKEIWQTAEIIFSTPQCVANDLTNSLYDLKDVSLLVIDEAHRCLKNYDYTKVVSFYKQQVKNQRILGLTASPGHDPEKIKQICEHLDIEEIELRSRDSEDVKPYLQSLEFQKIEVPFPKEFEELRTLLKRLWNNNVEKIKSLFPNLSPVNKITLLALQKNLSFQIARGNHAAYSGISIIAQAIKISHALELLETQTLSGLYNYLHSLIKQAQEKKSRAVQSLVKSPEFNAALISIEHLRSKHQEHPKIDTLVSLVKQEFSQNTNAKLIVFTQFRETAHLIVKSLSSLPSIKPSIFIGQAKKIISGNTSGLSQKEQKEIIEKFSSGEINTLICTAIGEEGLDIMEVNLVIFYEPIPSAIRKIQRAGRTARLSPGKLIILVTQDTRDVIHHYASSARERKMHRVIHSIKEELKLKKELEQKQEQEKAKIKTLDDFK
jgi:Fanconi anemia group M protein